jgi:2-methylcitrate dehydratase PrpD
VEFFGPPQATVLGRSVRCDALHASLLNGTAGAAYSFFDKYYDALLHPSGPVLAAILAISERTSVSGADFLAAFAVGIEVACRLTACVTTPPANGSIAWSQTGIACGAGAALAAGKLLHLDREQMSWALGIAISEASGTRICHGSMSAALIFGHAAQTGIRAAILAQRGFTGPDQAIEGRFGFASTFAETAHVRAITAGLGQKFELSRNTYKPYPCGILIHPSIDAVLLARSDRNFVLEDVARIFLSVSTGAAALTSRANPKDDLEAKFSIQHWAAAAAVRGKAGIAEGAAAAVSDAAIRRLRSVVEVSSDDNLSNQSARLQIHLKSGTIVERVVEHNVGSVENPMTDEQLEEKFVDQVQPVIGLAGARELAAACWQIEILNDASAIAKMLT